MLKEKTPMTLSQGESALGSHPMILEMAFASSSVRFWDSSTVKVRPVRPQV